MKKNLVGIQNFVIFIIALTGLYKCHAKCDYGEGQSSAMVKVEQSGRCWFKFTNNNFMQMWKKNF